jgi:hypothetical protein
MINLLDNEDIKNKLKQCQTHVPKEVSDNILAHLVSEFIKDPNGKVEVSEGKVRRINETDRPTVTRFVKERLKITRVEDHKYYVLVADDDKTYVDGTVECKPKRNGTVGEQRDPGQTGKNKN